MNKLILLVFSIFLFVGCSSTAVNNDKTDTTDTADTADISTVETWKTSTPQEQGIEDSYLSDADRRINENFPNIYSVLILRNGCLVYEKYYQGMDANSDNQIYSVTKSVMSALTGIAIKETLLESVDQKIADILPEYFEQIDDQRKKSIDIKDVLTMTGGLETIDTNYPQYFTSNDWLAYTIRKPMDSDPGTKFSYNTGLTQSLSAILDKTSKMSTLEFAEKYLFEPLNIDVKSWRQDGKGYYGGGAGLYLTPRDMAKLGYLYLKNGMWNGKQIVPSEWVKESTKKQISVSEDTDYGYLFWIWDSKAKINNKTYYTYAATGSGGQYIFVVPDLDLVTVITANDNSVSKDRSDTSTIFWDYVIPAMK